MNQLFRQEFNTQFAHKNKVIDYLQVFVGQEIKTPLAKTPVYVPQAFVEKMGECSQSIIDAIKSGKLAEATQKYVPRHLSVKNVTNKPSFLSIDYAVTQSEKGELEPKLVELQGFPSVFGYLLTSGEYYQGQLGINLSQNWTFPGLSKYNAFFALRKTILGNFSTENVVLIDYQPMLQHTFFDFKLTKALFGIETVCVTQITIENDKLYYHKDGQKIRIQRIYNRMIFNELGVDTLNYISLFNQAEVEWAAHPDWFFLLSKSALPLINSQYSPECHYLDQVDIDTIKLQDFIVKPLFDYSGNGVDLNPTKENLKQITTPQNYILQKRIKYANCIENPDGGVALKAELRVLYTWPDDYLDPIPVCMMARLTDGTMISVRRNGGSRWVGGTVGLMVKT